MIREGKLDEARQMCEEQTSAALGHLQSDPDWRQEYLDLWMHQRPPPFRITFDDYDFDGEQPSALVTSTDGLLAQPFARLLPLQQCKLCNMHLLSAMAGLMARGG